MIKINKSKGFISCPCDNGCKPFIAGQLAMLSSQGFAMISDGSSVIGVFTKDYATNNQASILLNRSGVLIETDAFDSGMSYPVNANLFSNTNGFFTTRQLHTKEIGTVIVGPAVTSITLFTLSIEFNGLVSKASDISKIDKPIGGNCTKCGLFNEYQECDYICYSCKLWSGN